MDKPTSEVVTLPTFRAETDALLARLDVPPGPADDDPYQALLRDRLEPPDPTLAGICDPATRPRDLKIELGDRVLEARAYLPPGDRPRPVLLWLHGGGFVGGDLRDIEYAASGLAIAGDVVVAVLREAAAGRVHWSLAPHWETPEAGRGLNAGGVDAGRHLPSALLIERLHSVVDALIAEIEQYDEQAWIDLSTGGGFGGSIGALAEYAATPPDGSPYGHVARHLR